MASLKGADFLHKWTPYMGAISTILWGCSLLTPHGCFWSTPYKRCSLEHHKGVNKGHLFKEGACYRHHMGACWIHHLITGAPCQHHMGVVISTHFIRCRWHAPRGCSTRTPTVKRSYLGPCWKLCPKLKNFLSVQLCTNAWYNIPLIVKY